MHWRPSAPRTVRPSVARSARFRGSRASSIRRSRPPRARANGCARRSDSLHCRPSRRRSLAGGTRRPPTVPARTATTPHGRGVLAAAPRAVRRAEPRAARRAARRTHRAEPLSSRTRVPAEPAQARDGEAACPMESGSIRPRTTARKSASNESSPDGVSSHSVLISARQAHPTQQGHDARRDRDVPNQPRAMHRPRLSKAVATRPRRA